MARPRTMTDSATGGNAIVAGTIRGLGKPGVAIGGPSEIRPVTLWARLECRFGLCSGRAKVSGQMPAVQIALPSACDARQASLRLCDSGGLLDFATRLVVRRSPLLAGRSQKVRQVSSGQRF
jgi:hypothetical protein